MFYRSRRSFVGTTVRLERRKLARDDAGVLGGSNVSLAYLNALPFAANLLRSMDVALLFSLRQNNELRSLFRFHFRLESLISALLAGSSPLWANLVFRDGDVIYETDSVWIREMIL